MQQLSLFQEEEIKVIPALPPIIKIEKHGSAPEPLRSSVKPLSDAKEIYTILSKLPIGAMVPTNVRIYDDEKKATIPPWMLWERVIALPIQILTIVDASTFHDYINTITGEMFLRVVACEVFTAIGKSLAGQPYTWFVGCERACSKLGDIRQHARQVSEREEFLEGEEEDEDE